MLVDNLESRLRHPDYTGACPSYNTRTGVLHELGALALNRNFQRMWEFTGDLVENAHLEGEEILQLTFVDAPAISLSIRTGRPPSD